MADSSLLVGDAGEFVEPIVDRVTPYDGVPSLVLKALEDGLISLVVDSSS